MNSMKKLFFACVGYAVLLIAAVIVAQLDILSGFAAVLVALVPLVPGIFVVLAVRDFIVSVDELQRKIQLEALAVAIAGTFLVLLAGALLPIAGIPEPSYVWPMAATGILWLVGQWLAHRRYQ